MRTLSLLLLLGLAIVAVGCDNAMETTTAEEARAAVRAAYREAKATRLETVDAEGRPEYRLEVSFDSRAEGLRLPKSLAVMPPVEGGEPIVVSDDGVGADAMAGDGIFSAVVPQACVADPDQAGKEVGPEVSCKIIFVAPGESCLGWGQCPDSKTYDFYFFKWQAPVYACWCIAECEISVSPEPGLGSSSTLLY